MAEQRVVGRPVNITGSPADDGGRGASAAEAPDAPKKGRKIWVIALIIVLALVGTAAYLLRPSVADAGEAAPPEPGVLVPVDPISVNLAEGHYLRLGFSMQLTAEAHADVNTAQALDIAIALYSGRTTADVNDPARRAELKAELLTQLATAFEGEVMDVYLTDFVTQ